MLIDDVLEYGKSVPNAGWFLELLRTATAVKIHNVADYVFQSPAGDWDFRRDFPNIAPPFDNLWMEWSHSRRWSFHDIPPDDPGPDRIRAGFSILGIDLRDPEMETLLPDTVRKPPPEARWMCIGNFILHVDDGFSMPPSITWFVSEDGHYVPESLNDGGIGVRLSFNPLFKFSFEPTEADWNEATGLYWFLPVPFMALTFMHCKKVELVKGPAWEARLQQARQRRDREPLVRWHTLVIDPVKKIVGSANGGNSMLSPKALHICRGHFKDFRQQGLFGKNHGIYWWPMHVRGSQANGEVHKDYLVRSP